MNRPLAKAGGLGPCRRPLITPYWLLLLGVLASGVPTEVAAQTEEPRRGVFHLAVGNLSFLDAWAPSLHLGYLLQFSVRKSQVSVDEFGFDEVTPPTVYVHTLVSGGYGFDTGDGGANGFSGHGQLGLLWRLDEGVGPFTVIGPVTQASLGPDGLGGAMRSQLLAGNAALSLGWMWFDDPRDHGVTVSIDLLRCILQDLGLVQSCIIP